MYSSKSFAIEPRTTHSSTKPIVHPLSNWSKFKRRLHLDVSLGYYEKELKNLITELLKVNKNKIKLLSKIDVLFAKAKAENRINSLRNGGNNLTLLTYFLSSLAPNFPFPSRFDECIEILKLFQKHNADFYQEDGMELQPINYAVNLMQEFNLLSIMADQKRRLQLLEFFKCINPITIENTPATIHAADDEIPEEKEHAFDDNDDNAFTDTGEDGTELVNLALKSQSSHLKPTLSTTPFSTTEEYKESDRHSLNLSTEKTQLLIRQLLNIQASFLSHDAIVDICTILKLNTSAFLELAIHDWEKYLDHIKTKLPLQNIANTHQVNSELYYEIDQPIALPKGQEENSLIYLVVYSTLLPLLTNGITFTSTCFDIFPHITSDEIIEAWNQLRENKQFGIPLVPHALEGTIFANLNNLLGIKLEKIKNQHASENSDDALTSLFNKDIIILQSAYNEEKRCHTLITAKQSPKASKDKLHLITTAQTREKSCYHLLIPSADIPKELLLAETILQNLIEFAANSSDYREDNTQENLAALTKTLTELNLAFRKKLLSLLFNKPLNAPEKYLQKVETLIRGIADKSQIVRMQNDPYQELCREVITLVQEQSDKDVTESDYFLHFIHQLKLETYDNLKSTHIKKLIVAALLQKDENAIQLIRNYNESASQTHLFKLTDLDPALTSTKIDAEILKILNTIQQSFCDDNKFEASVYRMLRTLLLTPTRQLPIDSLKNILRDLEAIFKRLTPLITGSEAKSEFLKNLKIMMDSKKYSELPTLIHAAKQSYPLAEDCVEIFMEILNSNAAATELIKFIEILRERNLLSSIANAHLSVFPKLIEKSVDYKDDFQSIIDNLTRHHQDIDLGKLVIEGLSWPVWALQSHFNSAALVLLQNILRKDSVNTAAITLSFTEEFLKLINQDSFIEFTDRYLPTILFLFTQLCASEQLEKWLTSINVALRDHILAILKRASAAKTINDNDYKSFILHLIKHDHFEWLGMLYTNDFDKEGQILKFIENIYDLEEGSLPTDLLTFDAIYQPGMLASIVKFYQNMAVKCPEITYRDLSKGLGLIVKLLLTIKPITQEEANNFLSIWDELFVKDIKTWSKNKGTDSIILLLIELVNIHIRQNREIPLHYINSCLRNFCALTIAKGFPIHQRLYSIIKSEPSTWLSQIDNLRGALYSHTIAGKPLEEIKEEVIKCKHPLSAVINASQIPGAMTFKTRIDYVFNVYTEANKLSELWKNKFGALEGGYQKNQEEADKELINILNTHTPGKGNLPADANFFGALSTLCFYTLYMEPYHVQLATVVGMMYALENKECQRKILAGVGTGQGKTFIIILTALAHLIKDAPKDIKIITLTSELARENHAEVKPLLDKLGIRSAAATFFDKNATISYGTALGLMWRQSHDNMKTDTSSEEKYSSTNSSLFIDETDVLLEDYFEKVHSPLIYQATELQWILRIIWNEVQNNSSLTTITEKIKANDAFTKLSDEARDYLLENLPKFHEKAVGVKDSSSTNEDIFTSQFQTATGLTDWYGRNYGESQFIQLKAGLSDDKIEPLMLVPMSLLYRESVHQFITSVGFSGTLGDESVLEFYKNAYNYSTFLMPNFATRNLKEGDYRIVDEKDHLDEIINSTQTLRAKQPVIIIMEKPEDVTTLVEAFKNKNITDISYLNETVDSATYNSKIEKATAPGSVFVTYIKHARGVDYKVQHEEVIENGGVALMNTYHQETKRLEDQVKGRIARLDNPGLYTRTYNKQHCESFITKTGIDKNTINDDNIKLKLIEARERKLQEKLKKSTNPSNHKALHFSSLFFKQHKHQIPEAKQKAAVSSFTYFFQSINFGKLNNESISNMQKEYENKIVKQYLGPSHGN